MTRGASPSTIAFPIVAVGASAGGLAATSELLRHLGDGPAAAVVIIQHLDAKRESNLAEILSRLTPMRVETARDGARTEIDRVYVIPPGSDMAIENGALRLSPRSARHAAHLPVDTFFESLAHDAGASAIGVVLSGTGADGARGVSSIKAEGGVTFAQLGAEHAGMPESAMATGCVDFSMPVEQIAAEIVRIGARLARGDEGDPADDEPSFQRILAAVRQASGVDFTRYKASTLRRRMQRRAVLRRLSSLSEYADLIAQDVAEVEALAEEVLIHVTRFFRDTEVWEALSREIIPQMMAGRRGGAPMRVWVPGCSSGEEVYSLAIALVEALESSGSSIPIKMFGTDVSRRAIDRARAAVYSEGIAEEVTPGRLARFFVKTERGYEVVKDVRDRCVFATHDITRDPPFSRMDLISCRNLMIYLTPAIQQRILPMLHYALVEHGYLVLGTAESVGAFPGFAAADSKNKIYARASTPTRFAFDFRHAHPWPLPAHPVTRSSERNASAGDVRREADRAILSTLAPAGVVLSDDLAIVEFRGDIAPYLEPTPGAATLDLQRMAREELRMPLRRAIDGARSTGKPARVTAVSVGSDAATTTVDIEVIPFVVPPSTARFFTALFTESAAPVPAEPGASKDAARVTTETALQNELAGAREYLQSVIEQLEAGNEELRAANEEIVSSNEELQSTNEELETAKEELQATNEELRTVNDEMVERNVEATRLADDLTNILSSVAIPIVILGRDSRIRRFTPAATTLLNLIATDIGRPITDIQTKVRMPDLIALVGEVLKSLTAVERTIEAEDGRWYQIVVRPYVTLDNRVDGAVISVYDVDALKKAETLVAEARDYAESIVETMRECLVIIEPDLRVRSANHAFHEHFKTTPSEIEGRRLDAMGPGRWDARALTRLLEQLAEGGRSGDVRIEVEVPESGRRVVIANGRRVARMGVILLALVDVTDRARMEDRITDYQVKLQRMAFEAGLTEERERRRIAHDLHDRIGQSLALARIKLESVRASAAGDVGTAIAAAIDLIVGSAEETRTLTFELSPPVLYDLGLKAALSWLSEEMEKRAGVHVDVTDDGERPPFEDAIAALLFRSVRELLANVFKHAQTKRACVALRRDGDDYEIDVEDAGVGFDADSSGHAPASGFGLFSVREQITRLGGTVAIESTPQRGTRVRLRVPVMRDQSMARGENG